MMTHLDGFGWVWVGLYGLGCGLSGLWRCLVNILYIIRLYIVLYKMAPDDGAQSHLDSTFPCWTTYPLPKRHRI